MEFPVSSCPRDPDSWREAGDKLNCSRDQYDRILYQCAPNKGKSSLVEFCLKGSVARIEKGLCVDSLSNGFLGVQKCSQFDYGCPDESYINNEIYKYPACLEMNTDEHCYVADPSCPNISRVRENSTDYFTIINGPTTATALQMATNALAAFGYTILVLGILLGLILFFKRRGHIYKRVSTDEETPADDLDGEVIARDIEEYGIDFILKCPFKKEQHDKIAKKLRIPIEILSWSKDDKEKFVRDLREGETRVYHGRCMVVGCGGVGKTTLVNNLRGVYEEEPASTVALDCYPNVFNVDDKKGLIVATYEEKSRQCTQICMKNLVTKADDSDDEMNNNWESSDVSSETTNTESNESESIADIEIFEKSQNSSIQIESNDLQKKKLNGKGSDQIQMINGSDNAEEKIVKDIQYKSKDTAQDIIQPSTEENTRIEKGKVEADIIPVESLENKKLSIMDFAGQSVYYACHHIYYSPRAFFILVMDMSTKLNKKPKDSSLSQGLMYSGWSNLDFMRYWLGSIHTYSSPDVPVILVASHSENITETELEYYKRTRKNLPEDLLKHLSLDMLFKVKKEKDGNIERIKKCIEGILKKQLHWGERIPTSWVSLEQIITRRKESVKVWKTDELWDYVKGNGNCRIERKDDLLIALNFFNDIGVILFKPQGKLRESIILDVQWFVDAFKCIIVDKEHLHMLAISNHDWDSFDSTGILQKHLLEKTWEKDPSFLNHKEGLTLHMINLGMMAELSEGNYFVPCMNKQRYNPAILKGFKVSSTLCFRFKYLPLVILHRLIATCMRKYKWKIWQGNKTESNSIENHSDTNTDYCIYHNATIFEDDIYKILIGMSENERAFGCKYPYLIELQIIVIQKHIIKLSKSRKIREKVEESLEEVLSYYPALKENSNAYKTGYRCCEKPFGTLLGHKVFTTYEREENSVNECKLCQDEIDFEKLTSYWTKEQEVNETGDEADIKSPNMSECQEAQRGFVTIEVPKKYIDMSEKIVAAIDFGTTYSGYSFSSEKDYEEDPLNITSRSWGFSFQKAYSLKTPTTILLDKDREFKSFGFKAEMDYADMDEGDHENFYYFQRFKMALTEENERKEPDIKIKDVTGKELSCSFVIGKGIGYLKNKLLHQTNRRTLENIYWVFTCPSLWNIEKQKALKYAAIQAGISEENLVIIEEASAVSYHLQHLPCYRQEGSYNMTFFKPERKYLLLDAGGGTVDITVYEIQLDRRSKILAKCSGPYGGTTVDKAFEKVLNDIVGDKLMTEYVKKYPADYIKMMTKYEIKKRTEVTKDMENILLRVPMTLTQMFGSKHKQKITEKIQNSDYAGKVTWKNDKFRMTKTFFISLFQIAFEGIAKLIKETLEKVETEGTDVIVMVGGFSESSQLRQFIRNKFSQMEVIVLPEPSLAVLRGAVLYGHQPVVFLRGSPPKNQAVMY